MMEQYRRRLERTQIKICILLLVLLFGGLLTLPWIGQVIWIAIIMAIYIRVIFVIARKEELLEELRPGRTNQRTARERRTVISDSDRTWVVGEDPYCDRRTTKMRRISAGRGRQSRTTVEMILMRDTGWASKDDATSAADAASESRFDDERIVQTRSRDLPSTRAGRVGRVPVSPNQARKSSSLLL
jgi:hypothetical protein